jgi:hypothetical protein
MASRWSDWSFGTIIVVYESGRPCRPMKKTVVGVLHVSEEWRRPNGRSEKASSFKDGIGAWSSAIASSAMRRPNFGWSTVT